MNMKIRRTDEPEGPGNNIFSFYNVEDNGDEIILEVNKEDKGWTCAEVSWSAKEGLYEFDLKVPVCLPVGIVCGIFLYQDDKNEIDIEFSRWNKFFNKNCQFVKQGTEPIRFWNFRKNNKIRIEYRKEFVTLNLNDEMKTYLHKSKFERFIANLWIYGEPAEAQIKIRNFKYTK